MFPKTEDQILHCSRITRFYNEAVAQPTPEKAIVHITAIEKHQLQDLERAIDSGEVVDPDYQRAVLRESWEIIRRKVEAAVQDGRVRALVEHSNEVPISLDTDVTCP